MKLIGAWIALLCCILLLHASAFSQTCNQQSFEQRPIPLGVSGGSIKSFGGGLCCSGTLGALVEKVNGSSIQRYVLSANHVMARSNFASNGELITQPGLIDLACQQNSGYGVAELSDSVPIEFSENANNHVDGAIASALPGEVGDTILNVGPLGGVLVTSPLGVAVKKMGRTSCLTRGQVSAVAVTILVNYPDICSSDSGVARFVNQIRVDPADFSAAGDSGSLVVSDSGCPLAVGLLFAGSDTSTFANPIADVLRQLDVTLVQGCDNTSLSMLLPPVPVATAWSSFTMSQTVLRAMAPMLRAPLAQDEAGANSPPPPSQQRAAAERNVQSRVAAAVLESAEAIKAKHEAELFKIPHVVGVGVGLSAIPGGVVIEVYVDKATREVRAAVPRALEGVRVRLIQTGAIIAY